MLVDPDARFLGSRPDNMHRGVRARSALLGDKTVPLEQEAPRSWGFWRIWLVVGDIQAHAPAEGVQASIWPSPLHFWAVRVCVCCVRERARWHANVDASIVSRVASQYSGRNHTSDAIKIRYITHFNQHGRHGRPFSRIPPPTNWTVTRRAAAQIRHRTHQFSDATLAPS